MSLGLDRLDRKNPTRITPGSWRLPTSHRSEEFPPQSAYLRWQVVDEQKAFGCPPNRGPLRDAVEGFSRVFPWVFPTKKVHIFVEDGGYGGTGSVVSPRFLAL